MICPKCGNLDYLVIKTIRGDDFDLREVYCSNIKCSIIFRQLITRIEQNEFIKLRKGISGETHLKDFTLFGKGDE